jgi:hypothetical protein
VDEAATRALQRLRDPDRAELAALARLVVDETTRAPMKTLATPRWLAGQVVAVLEAAVQGELLRDWAKRRLHLEQSKLQTEARTLRAVLPSEALPPLRQLLGRHYLPNEPLLLRILDQPAMRGLVGTVLADTVSRFRKRVSDVDKGLLGGIGKRAAARGRGLLGNFGGMAENIVEAVKEEVDQAMEGRVRDFLANATGEALKTVARYLSDPAHAAQFGEMRLAVLDVVLDTPIRELADEADKLEPEVAMDVVVAAIRSMLAAPDFRDRLEERIAQLLDESGDGTLGAWLGEVGLEQVWRDTTTELVRDRLAAVVGTDPFEAWWRGLFAP